jgi:hypothetical protein
MATKSQVKIYQALTDLVLKAIITLVVLGCFIVGFGFLIYLINSNHPWQNTILLGTVDGLIASSFPYILKHYFPNSTS